MSAGPSSVQGNGETEADQLVKLKQKLESAQDEAQQIKYLQRLLKAGDKITVPGLMRTGIGKTVRSLEKSPNPQVTTLSKQLQKLWKSFMVIYNENKGTTTAPKLESSQKHTQPKQEAASPKSPKKRKKQTDAPHQLATSLALQSIKSEADTTSDEPAAKKLKKAKKEKKSKQFKEEISTAPNGALHTDKTVPKQKIKLESYLAGRSSPAPKKPATEKTPKKSPKSSKTVAKSETRDDKASKTLNFGKAVKSEKVVKKEKKSKKVKTEEIAKTAVLTKAEKKKLKKKKAKKEPDGGFDMFAVACKDEKIDEVVETEFEIALAPEHEPAAPEPEVESPAEKYDPMAHNMSPVDGLMGVSTNPLADLETDYTPGMVDDMFGDDIKEEIDAAAAGDPEPENQDADDDDQDVYMTLGQEVGNHLKRKTGKTAVYSGIKHELLELKKIASNTLLRNVDIFQIIRFPYNNPLFSLEEHIMPNLAIGVTADQLAKIEYLHPLIIKHTNDFWLRFCNKKYGRSARPNEEESWKEMYFRRKQELEDKLANYTLKKRRERDAARLMKQPEKTAKLAYCGFKESVPGNRARSSWAEEAFKTPRVRPSSAASSSSSASPLTPGKNKSMLNSKSLATPIDKVTTGRGYMSTGTGSRTKVDRTRGGLMRKSIREFKNSFYNMK